MIIVLSSKNSTLDGQVDPRFGRCPFLIKMDTETKDWEAFSNPGSGQSGGAGVAAAQFVIDQKAQTVLSGDFGPHASRALKAAGVAMALYQETALTVSQAIEQFEQGLLPGFNPQD